MSKHLPQVIARVKASKIAIGIIAKDTGLNERWLRDVLRGQVPNASYEKIMTLETYIQEHVRQLVIDRRAKT